MSAAKLGKTIAEMEKQMINNAEMLEFEDAAEIRDQIKSLKEQVLRVGVEEIVFASREVGTDSHWYANFGYHAWDENQKLYRGKGRLCRLNLRSGELTVLLDVPEGAVRDPQVHYDGQKVLFSYRKPGSDYFNLYEIGIDGTELTKLTDGSYDDIEPTYVADG